MAAPSAKFLERLASVYGVSPDSVRYQDPGNPWQQRPELGAAAGGGMAQAGISPSIQRQLARQAPMAPSAASLQVAEPANDDPWLASIGKSVAHGFGSVWTGLGTAVGAATGWEGLADVSMRGQNYLDRHLADDSPEWYDRLAHGVGSMLGFILPGAGGYALGAKAGGAIAGRLLAGRAVGRAVQAIATATGATTGGVIESAVEMAEREQEILREGGTLEEAFNESKKIFNTGLIPTVALNLPLFHPARRLAQVALEAGSESLQEAAQFGIQQWARGVPLRDILRDPELRWAAGIGGIVGGGTKAAVGGRGYLAPVGEREQAAPTETPEPARSQHRAAQGLSEGGLTLDEVQAEMERFEQDQIAQRERKRLRAGAPGRSGGELVEDYRAPAPTQTMQGPAELGRSGGVAVSDPRLEHLMGMVPDMSDDALAGLYTNWQQAQYDPQEQAEYYQFGQIIEQELRARTQQTQQQIEQKKREAAEAIGRPAYAPPQLERGRPESPILQGASEAPGGPQETTSPPTPTGPAPGEISRDRFSQTFSEVFPGRQPPESEADLRQVESELGSMAQAMRAEGASATEVEDLRAQVSARIGQQAAPVVRLQQTARDRARRRELARRALLERRAERQGRTMREPEPETREEPLPPEATEGPPISPPPEIRRYEDLSVDQAASYRASLYAGAERAAAENIETKQARQARRIAAAPTKRAKAKERFRPYSQTTSPGQEWTGLMRRMYDFEEKYLKAHGAEKYREMISKSENLVNQMNEERAEKRGMMTAHTLEYAAPADQSVVIKVRTSKSKKEYTLLKKQGRDVYLGVGLGGLQKVIDKFSTVRQNMGTRDIDTDIPAMQRWHTRDEASRRQLRQRWRNPREAYESYYTHALDDLHSARKRSDEAAREYLGVKLQDRSLQDDWTRLMRLARAAPGIAADFINRKVQSFQMDKVVGDGLKTILHDPKYNIPARARQFDYYLRAKSIIETWRAKGPDAVDATLLQEARDIVAKTEAKEESQHWDEAAKRVTEFQNNVLAYVRDAGVLDSATYDQVVDMYRRFAPLHALNEVDVYGRRIGTGPQWLSPLKHRGEIKGGQAMAGEIETIVANTFYLVNLAHEGNAKLKLAELIEETEFERIEQGGDPEQWRLGQQIDPKMHPLFKEKQELQRAAGATRRSAKKALKNHTTLTNEEIDDVLDLTGYSKAEADVIKKLWAISAYQGHGVMSFMRRGKLQYYEVDSDVYDFFAQTAPGEHVAIQRFVSQTTKMLRAGVIIGPEFQQRNLLRDAWTALVQSTNLVRVDQGLPKALQDLVTVIPRLGRGFADAVNKTERYDRWVISGGPMAQMVATDMTNLESLVNEMLQTSTAAGRIKLVAKHPIAALQAVASFSELGTRLAVHDKAFNELLVAGKSRRESLLLAGLESRESTIDFARRGRWMPQIAPLFAFANPNVQGFDRTLRVLVSGNVQGKKYHWMKALLFITLPSLALWRENHDKDWYKRIQRWEKNLFWHIDLDGNGENILRLPKPFEIGMLFGSLFERIADELAKDDPKAVESWIQDFAVTTMPLDVSSFVPMFTASVEYATGKSFWHWDDQVKGSLKDELPWRQYTEATSATSKWLARSYFGTKLRLNPIKFDNWLRGSFGGAARWFTAMTDEALYVSGAMDRKERPAAKKIGPIPVDLPLTRALLVKLPARYTRYAADFYDYLEESSAAANTYNKVKDEGNLQDVDKLLADYGFWVALHPVMADAAQSISAVSATIKTVEADYADAYTPEEQRKALDQLYRDRNHIIQTVVEEVERLRMTRDHWLDRELSKARARLSLEIARRKRNG